MPYVLYEVQDQVAVITLNRPERMNALGSELNAELRDAEARFAADDEARIGIYIGAGDRAFCAGRDLKEVASGGAASTPPTAATFERGAVDLGKPMIAAINGAAYGGGCEFALSCDFIYAAEHARFALTEITLGIMPGAGGTMNLPQAVGERRAREIIYTGRPFSAAEGLEWGLVNQVCAANDLLKKTIETAESISRNAPISVRQAKKSIAVSTQVDRHVGYMFELEAYNRMVPTEDRLEGVRAFNEKRKPEFKGR